MTTDLKNQSTNKRDLHHSILRDHPLQHQTLLIWWWDQEQTQRLQ